MAIGIKIAAPVMCAFLLWVYPATSVADTLQLLDGQKVYGKISAETDTAVTIDAAKGRFTFDRNKVVKISRESPIQNQVREMEKYLAQGNIDTAMAIYHNSQLSTVMTTQQFNAAFVRHLGSSAVGAVATSGTALMLADKIQQQQITAPAELIILTAALCADTRNADAAYRLLRQVESDTPPHLDWPIETVSGLLNRIADSALDANHGALVGTAASLTDRLPLSAATSASGHLQMYARIEDLIRNNEHLEASALFKPDLFLRRADLFVPLAERLLAAILAAAPTDENIAALESTRVTVLPYVDAQLQIRAMKVLINRLLNSQRMADAQRIVDDTSLVDADLGAILQHLLDFHKRKAALPANSPMEAYRLASWGRSMGLLDESKALFLSLRSDPRFTETVNLQLSLIENAQANDTILRLRYLYDTNEIDRLKSESTAFLRTSPPEAFAQQARDLIQLADFQSWSSRRSSQGKAEAEYQQAERLANRREYDQALIHLNRIQLDREESAAAAKAETLRDRIMREKLKEAAEAKTKAQ